ncbi:hypothetical protein E4U54_006367 [Claviceps lovelessii]|nr:hypothetical protein E4U54_006367 [Claviceps lovelessii]
MYISTSAALATLILFAGQTVTAQSHCGTGTLNGNLIDGWSDAGKCKLGPHSAWTCGDKGTTAVFSANDFVLTAPNVDSTILVHCDATLKGYLYYCTAGGSQRFSSPCGELYVDSVIEHHVN